MPRVPRYTEPQVALNNLPDAQVNVRVTPQALGADIGQGLSNVGGVMAKFAEDAAEMASEDAFNKLRARQLDLQGQAKSVQADGVLKTDKEGRGFVDSYKAQYKGAVDEIAGGLGGMAARRFRAKAMRGEIEFEAGLRTHQREQINAHETNISQAVYATEMRNLEENPTEEALLNAIARADAQATKDLTRAGKTSPEQMKLGKTEAHSMMVSKAVNVLLDSGRDSEAELLFAKWGDNLTGKDRAGIEKVMTERREIREADQAASEVFGAFVAHGDDSAVIQTDKMMSMLDERFADRPEVLDKAKAKLREDVTSYRQAREERQAQRIDTILTWGLNGTGIDQIMGSREYMALDPKSKIYIRNTIRSMRRGDGDDDGDGSGGGGGGSSKTTQRYVAYYNATNDPQWWRKMTPQQILELEPKVGGANVRKMLEQQRTFRTNAGEAAQASFGREAFNRYAKAAGIKDEGELATFERKYREQLSERTLVKGSKLTEAEIDQAAKSLLDPVEIVTQRSLLGIPLGKTTDTRPAYDVQDVNNIVVPKGDEAVKARIIKAMKDAGVPPTAANFQRYYRAYKGQ